MQATFSKNRHQQHGAVMTMRITCRSYVNVTTYHSPSRQQLLQILSRCVVQERMGETGSINMQHLACIYQGPSQAPWTALFMHSRGVPFYKRVWCVLNC